MNLSTFTDGASILRNPKVWLKVMSQLRDGVMPPEEKPQPTSGERERVARWIEQTFDDLDQGRLARDPGRKVIHRLNRVEYRNTIRDLLGFETSVADKFPADGGGGGGFDNNADTLFIPVILMEKYLAAADEILAQNVRGSFESPNVRSKKLPVGKQRCFSGSFAPKFHRLPPDIFPLKSRG